MKSSPSARPNEEFLDEIKHSVEVNLSREGIPARVQGRVKRAYSVYQKLKRQKISLDQVYDLLGTPHHHRFGQELLRRARRHPQRVASHPRPHQGFHRHSRARISTSRCTLPSSDPADSPSKCRSAPTKCTASPKRASRRTGNTRKGRRAPREDDQRVAWLRQLVEWQREMRDPGEFMSTLKVDLYPEEVYTFTPRGKVIVLPREATPIDFAYAIHSDVGNTCVGAKVNGRIVPLQLQPAQRRRGRDPHAAEPPAQQGLARAGQDLPRAQQDQARHQCHRACESHRNRRRSIWSAKPGGSAFRSAGSPRAGMEAVASEYGCSKSKICTPRSGYGKFSARQVLQKFAPDQVQARTGAAEAAQSPRFPPPLTAADGAGDLVIKVKGIDDLLVYRAKCCNPIRGEAIVGYVTRGKGVAVHSTNCPNVQNLMYEVERKIDVEWARATAETFPVRLMVHTDDRPGMLNQLTTVLVERRQQHPQPGSQFRP